VRRARGCAAVVIALLVGGGGTAHAAVLTLSPASGPVGQSVSTTGTGYPRKTAGSITFNGVSVGSYAANGSGRWSTTFTVPQSAEGPATVQAGPASASFTVTASPPPPPPGGSPSGAPMPVGDLPGWRQIVADDLLYAVALGSFPSAVSSTWGDYPDGWPDTTGHGTYMPSKVVSISGGVLDMWVHTENGVHMVAVPYPLLPGASAANGMLYGRYVVRFRSDPVAGYKTAWLLWPDSETFPRDGEIDFPEGNLNGTMCAYMHHQGATSASDQDRFCTATTYTSWHTAVIEWLPATVRFSLDDKTIGTSTSRIPNTPMHWVLQTETATDGAVPSDSASGHVQVDWVAVYRPA
jgi:Glycosyl hydrolases family 16